MSNITLYNRQNNNQALMPVSIEDKLAMAETLAKSGLMPSNLKTPQQVFAALQRGHELGLSPMVAVNNIAVINGRPTLGADIMHALVRSNPEYAGCEWKSMTAEKAEVSVTRESRGRGETFTGYFDMTMAQKAGLTGKDVWIKYPQRMLKHRALAYALRDAFPDVLAGIYTQEEMDGAETRDVTEPRESPAYNGAAPPPAPPCTEEHKALRQRLIGEISKIMTQESADALPYFTGEEKDAEKELIRKAAANEQGITLLEGQKTRLALELESRIKNYKPIDWPEAAQEEEGEGEEEYEEAAQEGEGRYEDASGLF